MKKLAAFLLFALISINCFSQIVNVTIDVTNAAVNGGMVYLAIFANAEEFRKEEPFLAFQLGDSDAVLSQEVSLMTGEYVLSAFQDANGNGTLDFRLGIPRELVGISNYNGKGFPSRNFDRQKIPINSTTDRIVIALYKFF